MKLRHRTRLQKKRPMVVMFLLQALSKPWAVEFSRKILSLLKKVLFRGVIDGIFCSMTLLYINSTLSPPSHDIQSKPETNMTTLSVLLGQASIRNKKETIQEKKARKGLVKELRRARREERKNTRSAFRDEGIKQAKADINRARDKCIKL